MFVTGMMAATHTGLSESFPLQVTIIMCVLNCFLLFDHIDNIKC